MKIQKKASFTRVRDYSPAAQAAPRPEAALALPQLRSPMAVQLQLLLPF
jgi:hypothetical protein